MNSWAEDETCKAIMKEKGKQVEKGIFHLREKADAKHNVKKKNAPLRPSVLFMV